MRTTLSGPTASARRFPAAPRLPAERAPRLARGNDASAGSCACGGACPRCKPRLAASHDLHEREADDAAEQVLRGPGPSAPAGAGAGPGEAAGSSGGRPLPSALRSYFEPRFGADFSAVRLHAGADAADSAAGLKARAYTLGNDVVFGADEYAPHTAQGQKLIAHELAHVVQQSGGTAPAKPQRKEVGSDAEIKGVQDWTTADRAANTQRWQDACLANLNALDSSQYVAIVERRDFYKWFYEYTTTQGYTTRWALAASVVAHGAHQIADMDDDFLNAIANEKLGLATVQLRGDLREGNQVIFDNVLPKLKKLLDGGPLSGPAALQWDMQVLAEEQTLIQPLYAKMSKDSLAQLNAIARQSGVLGVAASATGQDQVGALPHGKGGTVPGFAGSDITAIGERWKYGMGLGKQFAPTDTGYDPNKSQMPSVGAGYADGTEFARVDTRSHLHQLDAWLTSDADTRVGSGRDIDAIIATLTDDEKKTIVTGSGPNRRSYASLFADAKGSVTPAQIKKAMPTDPKLGAAVKQFWKDYAAASRSIVDDVNDMIDMGKGLWNTGEDLYHMGEGAYKTGEDVYEVGKSAYKTGKDVYETGKDVYHGAESLYDAGKSLYDLLP